VKDNILQKEIKIPLELQKKFPQLTDSLVRLYIDRGDINFSKSDTKRDSCRMYYIAVGPKSNGAFEVTNCDKTLTVISYLKP
jgi:hypothetical protein